MASPYFPGEPHPSAPSYTPGIAPLSEVTRPNGNVICPTCNKDYGKIGTHWSQSSTCSHPPLSRPQKDLLTGILLSGGGVNQVNKGYDRASFTTYLQNLSFAEWLQSQLGVHAGALSEHESKDEVFGNKLEETVTSWTVTTRSLPELFPWIDQWSDGNKRRVPDSINVNSRVLRALYAYQGRREWHENHDEHCIAISLKRTLPTDEQFEEIFGRFSDWRVSQSNTVRIVGEDEFFGVVGKTPVYSLSEKWPR